MEFKDTYFEHTISHTIEFSAVGILIISGEMHDHHHHKIEPMKIKVFGKCLVTGVGLELFG